MLAPVKINKFGATVGAPVVPHVNVLVTDMFALNPPAPVALKLVAVAILKTVVAAVVCVRFMNPAPKLIARVSVPDDTNCAVLKLNPLGENVP